MELRAWPTSPPRPADDRAGGRQQDGACDERESAHRDADHEHERPHDPEPRDAQQVRKAGKPRPLAPGAIAANGPQERGPDDEIAGVEHQQTGERPRRHEVRLTSALPSSSCQTTSPG